MDKLDRMVVTHLEERLLDPERIEDVLASLLDRRQEGVERHSQHIGELRQRATEADHRLNRLYDAIEAGSLDPAESALSERIAGLTAIREQARADAARIEAMLKTSTHNALTGAAVRELATEGVADVEDSGAEKGPAKLRDDRLANRSDGIWQRDDEVVDPRIEPGGIRHADLQDRSGRVGKRRHGRRADLPRRIFDLLARRELVA